MVEIMPVDGAGQFAVEMAEIKRRLSALETMRRTPFTDIYDADGNLLGKLSADGLAFFDLDGDPASLLDATGITVYDASGNPITQMDAAGLTVYDGANVATELDGDGITVYDGSGNAEFRAGDLDGMGDFGVEIGGGRARAMAIDTQFATVKNISIGTTLSARASITITPPSWAREMHVIGWIVYQLSNQTGAVVQQEYRLDFDGEPGEGAWTNDVQPSGIQVGNATSRGVFTGTPLTPINVDAVAAVSTGTNTTNIIRVQTMTFFLR